MATDEAKPIYKQRAATAETVNGDGKAHRGLGATALRGLDKVNGGACPCALTTSSASSPSATQRHRGLAAAVRRSRANRA